MNATQRRKAAGALADELETKLGRPLTRTERRAAWLVASSPVKASKRLLALEDLIARQEAEGAVAPAATTVEEVSALETAFAGAVRCSRCGLALTDPTSVAAGMGPDCRTKASAR